MVARRAHCGLSFKKAMAEFDPDLVLCDTDFIGLEEGSALTLANEIAPKTPVIFFTGGMDEGSVIQHLTTRAAKDGSRDDRSCFPRSVEAILGARGQREELADVDAALRESEERFQRLVETVSDAVVSFDSGGEIGFMNPSGDAMFGYESGEILGQCLTVLIREIEGVGGSEGCPTPAEDAQGAGISEPLHLTGVRRDGTTFPVEVAISSWSGEGGRHFNAVIRDLSERFLAQEAIESLSHHYELLLNSAGEGILGLDPEGNVTFVNPAAKDLLGLDTRELLGRDLHSVVHERSGHSDSVPSSGCPVVTALREGSGFRGELGLFRADGTVFPVAASCTPILQSGSITGAVMIFEDITLRKEQEAALRASEERYRGLVEHATYGIYRSSVDGTFLDVNSALVEMLGYDSREDLMRVEMGTDLYASPDERRRLVENFQGRDRVVGAETTWVKKDGSPVSVGLSGRSIWEEDGSFQAFEVVVEDLTERKILEDQLRQSQKMEAVGQLTGGIAHDFNNVLSVVLLNSELLLAAAEAGEPVDLDDLRAIHASAKRASSITKKLLGFSRKAELLMEPIHLGRVVGNLSAMLRTVLPETIELQMEVSGVCSQVLADTGSVEQMVLNLIANARDAMPDGGKVTVRVSEVELDEEYSANHPEVQAGPHVCIEVSDTGVGMSPETLEKVFEPFFTTKAPGSGTGLGMAMVYGLTKQQGGHVNIYTQVGEGTVLRLYFPAQSGVEETGMEEACQPGEVKGSGTILLVEDDENLRGATKRVLEGRGFKVFPTGDGEEALEFLREHPGDVNLVLSDLVLPRMGGVELHRRLEEEDHPVSFILSSGYSGEELTALGLEDSSVPFIRKPWVLRDLLSLIQTTLDPEASRQEKSNGQHSHH